MKYLVKLTHENGINFLYVNPDHVKCIIPTLSRENEWQIHLIGHDSKDSVLFTGDITPLIELSRQEPITYTVPLEAMLSGVRKA